jgi:NAD+ synthase
MSEEFCKWAYEKISKTWDFWMETNKIPKNSNWIIGISGGKDSTVVAALAVKKFGKDRVFGITLPCDGQKDFDDSMKVINHLGIKMFNIDIGNSVDLILAGIENNALDVSYDTKTNLPARIRMSTLYAVAQSVGGIVLNTCNLTEDILGYCTLFGDNCGSFAPIRGLTVTEVIELGDWLGVPYELTHKTPIDGLQPLTDEDKLGMKYADIDKYIRNNEGTEELKSKINEMYEKNKFKLKIVDVPGSLFPELENYVFYHKKSNQDNKV